MKTKNPYIAVVALFILAISVYSCRKDFLADDIPLNAKVDWARDYFKQTLLPNEGNTVDPYQYVSNVLQANLMSKKKENQKVPIWQKALEGKTSDYAFVEVPLKYTTKVTPMIYRRNPDDNSEKTADKEVLKASLDRLIIFKKKGGQIDQRIISFIPTKAYLDRHNGDISHNEITKLDKDFDGYLVYRKWNGEFESALIIKNGKGVKRILLGKLKPKIRNVAFKAEICEDYDVLEWFQDCYYDGDNPVPFYCGEPYSTKIGVITICVDDGEPDPCLLPENFESCNGNENGGGGGGPTDEGSEEYDFGNSVSEHIGSYAEADMVIGIDTFKVAKLNWKYHDGITWAFESTERGAVRVKNGIRTKWHSLSHHSNIETGYWALGAVEVITPVFTPHLGDIDSYMDVDYQVKYTPGITGGGVTAPPVKSNLKNSYCVWDRNFQKR